MFVIAILGCADGSAQCQQIATLPTRYESRATCAAATENVLMRATSYDFSEVQAECRAVTARGSAQKARPVRSEG